MHITTVSKLVAKHPGLSEGGVRWAIFNAENNGLAETNALLKKGRRLFIVEERYLEWLSEGAISSKGAAA